MSKAKDFDCVEMKNAIQQELLKQRAGLSDEEVRVRIRHELETSQSPIARWWRSINTSVKQS